MSDTKIVCTVKEGSDIQKTMLELCARDDISTVIKLIPGINDETILYE